MTTRGLATIGSTRLDVAVVLDVVAVAVFVGIGRSVHDHGVSPVGMASTAWPFLVGLTIGWLVARRLLAGRPRGALRRPSAGGRRSDLRRFSAGAVVCVSTVAVGMVLRVVSGQGTAVAFVAVALCFLGATMSGWRAILWGLQRLGARSLDA